MKIVPVLYFCLINVVVSDRVGDRKVYLSHHLASWFTANFECGEVGMKMLTITTLKENEEMQQYAMKKNISSFWIGANDFGSRARSSRSRTFLWAESGTRLDKLFWKLGEPNDRTEHCIEVLVCCDHHNWNDNKCSSLRPFICEELSHV